MRKIGDYITTSEKGANDGVATLDNSGQVPANQLGNAGGGGGSGIFGISDASGAYTYYATIQLALAAASSGDVIEQFSNATVSTSTTVTLVDGITWNMNGYTYKNTSTSSFTMIEIPNNTVAQFTINNGRIIRTTGSSAGGTLLDTGNMATSIFRGDSVTFENTEDKVLNGESQVVGGVYIGSSTSSVYYQGDLIDIKILGAGAITLVNGARIFNSTVECSNGYTTIDSGSKAYNCTFKGTDYGLRLGNGANRVYNCYAEATVYHAIYVLVGEIHNCSGFSSAFYGIQLVGLSAKAYNCTAISSAQVAMYNKGLAYNCYVESSANNALVMPTAGAVFKNGSILCKLNSSTGRGAYVTLDGCEITSTEIEVTNASAPCISGGVGKTVKMANNVYKGSTTAITTVTNAIVNTQDNQGNILI